MDKNDIINKYWNKFNDLNGEEYKNINKKAFTKQPKYKIIGNRRLTTTAKEDKCIVIIAKKSKKTVIYIPSVNVADEICFTIPLSTQESVEEFLKVLDMPKEFIIMPENYDTVVEVNPDEKSLTWEWSRNKPRTKEDDKKDEGMVLVSSYSNFPKRNQDLTNEPSERDLPRPREADDVALKDPNYKDDDVMQR